jgi:enterochelin esterase family protein
VRFPTAVLALLLAASTALSADDYSLGPDSQVQNVPRGAVRQGKFESSRIFPGTTRDYFVYVPHQYDPSRPACLMVFFDGAGFFRADGQFRVPTVFDNLIARKEMPVTIAVGITPGIVRAAEPGARDRSNRSFEYDSLGDTNARFLLDELLPAVTSGLNLTRDPAGRAICGNSSGAIAAFTVAWERPDQFRKVVSHIGSYTNIRGGFAYAGIVRQTKPAKPLRIFLQDGRNDLDNLHGNWPLANQEVAAALKFAGYDHQLVLGEGAHSGKHGGAIFPDTLRWLWRDWPKP